MSCCVPRCSQKWKKNVEKISYHSFPTTNDAVRQKWIDVISVANRNLKVHKKSKVCSYHFSQSCFLPEAVSERRILKPGSIPSIFEWDSNVFDQYEKPANTLGKELSDMQIENSIYTPMEQEQDPLISSQIMNEELTTGTVAENSQCEVIIETNNSQALVVEAPAVSQETLIETIGSEEPTKEHCHCSNLILEVKELNEKCSELRKKVLQLLTENERLKASLKFQKTIALSKTKQLAKEKRKSSVLEEKCQRLIPTLESLKGRDEDVQFRTGMPNYDRLLALYEFVNPGNNCENINFWGSNKKSQNRSHRDRPVKLKPTEQFLMVMMRLRLGLFVKDLSDRFGVSMSVVSNIFTTWINLMHMKFGKLVIWPSRKSIDETMPDAFKKDYPSTRVVIDAIEIKVEKSNYLVLKSGTYSTYKSTNTLKALIGITPVGLVSFVSNLYTDDISGKELIRRSGFLNMKFDENDSVMSEKGFLIEEMLKEKGLSLNIPPFLGNRNQFSQQDIKETQKVASLRIHVERQFQRIRCFHIFDRPIPITLGPVVNQIWTVCAIMSNMQSQICAGRKESENLNDVEPVVEIENLSDLEPFLESGS